MSNQQLDICDIHELLFDSQESASKFDFLQAWNNLSGEMNNIKSNEKQQQSTESSIFPEIGDITTPASVMNDSPLMDTPFLDSSINTPYTPASVFTPSLAQFQNYPTYVNNPLSGIDELSDIQVASYLKNDVSWPELDLEQQAPDSSSSASLFFPQTSYDESSSTPALNNSSSDPSPVLFDKVNSADDDSLFPPLSSDNNEALVADFDNSADLFNSDDFTSNLFDDSDFVFDDCFIEPSNDNLPIVLPVAAPKLNKRKQDDEESSNIPKPKRRKFKTPLDSEERKFECPVCHVSFSRRYNLGTHVKTHDNNRAKEFPCGLCTKGFDRKHDLSRHIATVHNGERAFSCSLCTCTFSRKDALGRHMTQKHSDLS